MKQKISVISGLGIAMLLVSLFSGAAPASADTAYWSAESIPSTIYEVLGPDEIDVRDLAVASDGTTIYAVAGNSVSDNVVYKSTDTGIRWRTLSVPIKADLIAVAQDDADIIVIANSSTPEVCLTIDGGSIWYTLGTLQGSGGAEATAVYDLAISKASEGIHYIAAAGKDAVNDANVWYFETGAAAPVWKETKTLAGFSNADEVAAVAFSPNFPSDEAMVAISADYGASVNLQILSFSSNKWNDSANFAGYPVTIVSSSGITDLTSASVSLAPTYLASDSSRRTAFVGLTINGDTASGIYRLVNYTKTTLKTGITIHSIAFDGTNLVAGDYGSTTIYRSANPLVTTPTISTVATRKGPGGVNKAVVVWAGGKVLAGTSGNESAFAVSTDNGATFNDISLIDTVITKARDVAVSADGSKVYLVTTDNDLDLSLWCQVSNWERVISQQGADDYVVRIAPGNADVIYLAEKGNTTIYYNKSGGKAEWITRTCRVNVQDLAVESADVAYALNSSGYVSKTTNAGYTWGTAMSTELDSGATIVSTSPDNLLVGSQDGYVAYSTNGNSSWTEISVILQTGASRVQVIADEDFATNKTVYAASDTSGQNIKKWLIGTSTGWTDIFKGTLPGGIYGLTINGGILYALEFNANTGQSTLWRCLSPTTTTSTSTSWSSSTTTADTDEDDAQVHLNATPRALKVSSGKLWAVKTNGTNKLYSFTDITTEVTVMRPASGFTNPVNAMNGLANDVAFSWEGSTEATEYELQIAYDEDFYLLAGTITIESEEETVLALVGPHQTGDARVHFMAGTTYYWRVRTTQPLYSLYSATRSFNIEPMLAMVPGILIPANGSTDVSRTPSFSWEPVSSASKYQFMLSANTTMTSPIIDTTVENAGFNMTEELDYGATYFWKVRAIEPAVSGWSTLGNFTVEEEPTEPVPPIVVQQVPPTIIKVPAPPAPIILTFTPSPVVPPPVSPNYLRAAIIIAAVLLLAVLALLFKPFTVRPVRVAGGFGDRLGKLGEGLATYFKAFNPLRTFRGVKAHLTGADEVEASQPISFAAKSFLWMMSAAEKGEGQHLLSAGEEQALGKILASRIQAIAKDHLLYQKFPKDAALFLYLWSHYGSRDETNRYLTNSFQSRPENVIRLLKCYLPTPQVAAPGLTRKTYFNRTQYNSLAEVVDPDKVYEALTKLYGTELDRPEDEAFLDSTDKAVASQFARIHHRVKSEKEKAAKTARQSRAGIIKADAK